MCSPDRRCSITAPCAARHHPAATMRCATPRSLAAIIVLIYERTRAGGIAAVISCEPAAPVDFAQGGVAALRSGGPDHRRLRRSMAFAVAWHRLVGGTTGAAVCR